MGIDTALYRQVAGSFATGVTIITTGFEGSFHGMTASAFTSVSLDPNLILVCIDRTANTLPILQACGWFNVNILSSGQEQLSRIFASKDAPERDGLQGIAFSVGRTGVPRIDGTLAHLECRVTQQFDGGDHVIIMGEVQDGALDAEAEPLLYFRGRYRRLGA